MRLEFKRIISIIVKNIRFVGEVFQIEVSDVTVIGVGVEKMYTCIQLGCLRRARFRDLMQKDHSNKCTK